VFNGAPFPATASAEGAQVNVPPFPATASAEGAQVNVPPFPATASAEGAQVNVPPSLWEREPGLSADRTAICMLALH
jgi:hypothetical protein